MLKKVKEERAYLRAFALEELHLYSPSRYSTDTDVEEDYGIALLHSFYYTRVHLTKVANP